MSDEELTTGFGSWLTRQPEGSEAGKLAGLLREDLARGRIGSWPRTRRQVREWAEKLTTVPTQAPLWLLTAADEWQQWLESLNPEVDLLAQYTASRRGSETGRPADNPFKAQAAEATK